MSMFDYKHYTSTQSATLMTTSQQLAMYTNISPTFISKTFNFLGKALGNYLAHDINANPPENWRSLTPKELGLPDKSVDWLGFYTIKSPITGQSNLGLGAQAKIFGEFDDAGKLKSVCLSFCGTNDLLDIADYFQIHTAEIVPNFEPLLNAIKAYAQTNGLTGEDVLITGFSLGGAFTNMMAKYRDTLADGFFNDANYIGHNSPYIYDNDDVILNMGYENDVVYRILGNEATIADSIKAGKPGLVNPDKLFDTTFDNIVLFNDTYASKLWDISPFSLLNIPFGWAAHVASLTTDAVKRITDSTFYQYTSRDSTVILDNLTALKRGTTWVEDKAAPTSDHYGTPAFIIGNARDNLLKGGIGGDYIDAGAGNDKIKTGTGSDRVDGGSGTDTIVLEGKQSDWRIYHLKNGDVFFHAKNGSGLAQISDVEQVSFSGDWRSQIRPYLIDEQGLIDKRFPILKHLNQNLDYATHREGTDQADTLTAKTLFGMGGDDVLNAVRSGSLIHAGEGNDVLRGNRGNDELYGAEGNDILYGGAGHDTLYGGVGNDQFIFDRNSKGVTIIHDFNHYDGDADRLVFAKDVFGSRETILSHARAVDDDVQIQYKGNLIMLKNQQLDDLANAIALI